VAGAPSERAFALIATERRALADLVDGLSEGQLATPSLCAAWTVKDVAAHLMAAVDGAVTEFLVAWVRGRFSFDKANQRMTAARASLSVATLTAMMREHAESRLTPPTMDWHAPLSDVMIHREDIAVPLGLPSDRPADSWRHVLDFVVSPKARRGFVAGRLPDVRLVATDVDWSHGAGPEVTGPAASLALVISGRAAGLEPLSGPGRESLATWVG
jgi:uncharacterized protein (TIGR03083 family)